MDIPEPPRPLFSGEKVQAGLQTSKIRAPTSTMMILLNYELENRSDFFMQRLQTDKLAVRL